MFTQLNPTIPVTTPKGDGYAIGIIDYSQEHNLIWVVAIDETGEIWSYQNPEVRVQKNITMGRKKPDEFNTEPRFGPPQNNDTTEIPIQDHKIDSFGVKEIFDRVDERMRKLYTNIPGTINPEHQTKVIVDYEGSGILPCNDGTPLNFT